MLRTEYKFTNEYGLPILDDSRMDSKKADAYMEFLEDSIKKDAIKKNNAEDEAQREILMMA